MFTARRTYQLMEQREPAFRSPPPRRDPPHRDSAAGAYRPNKTYLDTFMTKRSTLTFRCSAQVHLRLWTPCRRVLSKAAVLFFFFRMRLLINLFIYLCWVFISVRGLSLVVASGGHSSSRCAGLSLSRSLLLRSTGSRRTGSVVVAHGPICSAACGIFPDQGSNLCLLHWQADSQPLRHQGSP